MARVVVSLRKKRQGVRSLLASPLKIIALLCLVVVGLIFVNSGSGNLAADMGSLMPATETSAALVKEWRASVRKLCQAATDGVAVHEIGSMFKDVYKQPTIRSSQPRDNSAVKPCKRVLMDFGANVGDTSAHLIDAGLPACDRSKDLGASTPFPHFNVETKIFEQVGKRNPLTHQLTGMMRDVGSEVGPEDYCYYGVEGNPVFTERLQGIEDHVLSMSPKPVKHMHFFTESVGAGEDGMTKLYLDTVNEKQNFWGSSIMQGHQDVRKSNEGNEGELKAADVMGYTIGTLMRKTLTAFDPTASEEEKSGNHLVLKVDIEGGEYPLLHQAAEEGTLCEFVKNGNKADLFIEFHSGRVTGGHEFLGKTQNMKEKLQGCGVNFRDLAAWWA